MKKYKYEKYNYGFINNINYNNIDVLHVYSMIKSAKIERDVLIIDYLDDLTCGIKTINVNLNSLI